MIRSLFLAILIPFLSSCGYYYEQTVYRLNDTSGQWALIHDGVFQMSCGEGALITRGITFGTSKTTSLLGMPISSKNEIGLKPVLTLSLKNIDVSRFCDINFVNLHNGSDFISPTSVSQYTHHTKSDFFRVCYIVFPKSIALEKQLTLTFRKDTLSCNIDDIGLFKSKDTGYTHVPLQ